MTPFADATGNLSYVVTSVQPTTAAAIRSSFDPSVQGSKAEAEQRAVEFEAKWEHCVRAADAFAAYAEGLAAVAKAGNEGEAAAKQVTDQFVQLVDNVKPGFGASAAVSAVGQAADKIAGEIIRWQAAKKLDEAVARNHPFIVALADALDKDWETLKSNYIDASFALRITQALRKNEANDNLLAGLRDARQAARKSVVGGTVTPPSDDQGRAGFAAAQQRLSVLDAQYAAVVGDPEYQANSAELRKLEKSRAEALRLIDQAEFVTTHWAMAHDDLRAALRDRKSVSFKRLLALSQELIAIYQNMGDK